ncbi:MAG: hypothetical protein IJ433_00010 [Ruminococcus sp.]|nr:hypothetical protein [Ruminococcus sp.]
MNDKHILISDKNKTICDTLKSLGYKLIYTECVDEFISYEQNHADMQCIQVEDTVFILSNCKKLNNQLKTITKNLIETESLAHGKYPHNVLLNAKVIGKNLIGKIDYLDKKLVNYCVDKGYNLINVKQGYSGCSILKITDNAVITTDESIYKALQNTEIEVLKISQNGIELLGSKRGEQGLIGGASINLGESILFFGDISKHEDYENIVKFCNSKNISINYIKDMNLTDIGSGVLLNI